MNTSVVHRYPSVWLIRHGQTDSNAGGVLQGHLPTALNDLGRRQAVRLAERLGGVRPPLDALVSSDLLRALETAQPIAKALGLALVQDRAWRERGFGALEGQTLGEIDIWRAASGAVDPPGGESGADFERRVVRALVDVVTVHRGRDAIGVVTHGGPMRMVLSLLETGRLVLAPGHEAPSVAAIANASILRLAVEPGRPDGLAWRVLAVNDVAHLDGLVTATDAG